MAFGWNGSICFLIAFQIHAYPLLNLTLFILNLEFQGPRRGWGWGALAPPLFWLLMLEH